MNSVLILMAAAVLGRATCVAVSSPGIVAGDLAETVPLLRLLDPATPLGFAPLPGTRRIFTGRQWNQILQRYGIPSSAEAGVQDICVERVASPILSADLKAALLSALKIPGAEIDLIDFSKQSFPPGRLDFDRAALNKPPEASPNRPVIWRGSLIYDGQHRAPVWAKVQISIDTPRLIALENIPPGTMIRPEQFGLVTGAHFPDRELSLSSLESVLGKQTRRNIGVGQTLIADMLEDPPEIRTGDKIHIKVVEGGASLLLDAVAQSSGKQGDTIVVHNLSSGRNFHAVVMERGEALVRPGAL